MSSDDAPLKSSEATEEPDEPESEGSEEGPTEAEPAARPAPAPAFKASTFVLTFLFLMGLLMIFDNGTRNQVAAAIGVPLSWVFGFGGKYLLLTMFLAAVFEMLLTAVAYNWTTDWVKAARVQSWSGSFRKVQLAAMKSGKKDRIATLQPHQARLTKLTSEVSIAQLKGMAVTWFLVIAIYTWVGLFIAAHPGHQLISIGGASVSLMAREWIVPLWFLLFSLYTVPFSLVFRRILKHYSLLAHARAHLSPGPEAAAAGGSS